MFEANLNANIQGIYSVKMERENKGERKKEYKVEREKEQQRDMRVCRRGRDRNPKKNI